MQFCEALALGVLPVLAAGINAWGAAAMAGAEAAPLALALAASASYLAGGVPLPPSFPRRSTAASSSHDSRDSDRSSSDNSDLDGGASAGNTRRNSDALQATSSTGTLLPRHALGKALLNGGHVAALHVALLVGAPVSL